MPVSSSQLNDFDKFVEKHAIVFIRFYWVDIANQIRYMVFPVQTFRHQLANSDRPGISLASCTLSLVGSYPAQGFGAQQVLHYAPDLSSLKLCPYAGRGYASILGFFQVREPGPDQGIECPLDPRTFLKRIVQKAKEKHGITFKMGFEHEFTLLKPTEDGSIIPVNSSAWCMPDAMPVGSAIATAMEEMATALIAAGIKVEMFHAEGSRGQYELVTGPAEPMEAVDNVIFTRETIRSIAQKHGYKATFAPQVLKGEPGNGSHVHISLKSTQPSPPAKELPTAQLTAEERKQKKEPPTFLTRIEASFLEAFLSHLPAICAIGLPTTESFRRIASGIWSGGSWVAWGHQNREATVRICASTTPGDYNFEIRSLDACAQPYLTVAAMLVAGLDGIERNAQLTIKGTQAIPSQLNEEERKALGIKRQLPKDFKEAWAALKEDKLLCEYFGEEFMDGFLVINQHLNKSLKRGNEEETVKALVGMF